jgi:hypothetical protein
MMEPRWFSQPDGIGKLCAKAPTDVATINSKAVTKRFISISQEVSKKGRTRNGSMCSS